jgi:hypothetical protein
MNRHAIIPWAARRSNCILRAALAFAAAVVCLPVVYAADPPAPPARPSYYQGLQDAAREAAGGAGAAVAATAPAADAAPASPAGGGDDLRALIGVNPGLKRAEIPRLPAMSLRGFVQPHGGPPQALLEISELNRVFLVQEGTEIPITVAGRVSPVGRAELTGLGAAKTGGSDAAADAQGQSQIILTVVKISNEGVTVKAGLMAQTMIIR